jgi:membrane protease YdiL (CAAX protease family)
LTEPDDRGTANAEHPPSPQTVPPDGEQPSPGAAPPGSSRPGLRVFTIEGRAAPGLFVVGWIATILGAALTLGGVLGSTLLILLGLGLLAVGLVAGAGSQAIERRARGEVYAGPSPLLVFAAAIPVTFFIAALVGVALSATGVRLSGPAASLILIALEIAIYIGLVRLLVVGTGALSWREMGFLGSWRRAAGDAIWGAVFAGPVLLLTSIVAFVLVGIAGRAPESPLPPTGDAVGLVLNLLAGAVLAPIGEETLFRGFATTAWARTVGATAAIVRSGIVFAVAHVIAVRAATLDEALAIALVGFGTRLPIAIVLGILLLRRGTIWAPIGLHAAFNGVILVLAELAPPTAAASG